MPFQLFVQDRSGELIGQGIQQLGAGVGAKIDEMQKQREQWSADEKALQSLAKTHPELVQALGYDQDHTSRHDASRMFQGLVKSVTVGNEVIKQQQLQAEAQYNQARAAQFQATANNEKLSTAYALYQGGQIDKAQLDKIAKAAGYDLTPDGKPVSNTPGPMSTALQQMAQKQDAQLADFGAAMKQVAENPMLRKQLDADRSAYQALAKQANEGHTNLSNLYNKTSGLSVGEQPQFNAKRQQSLQKISEAQQGMKQLIARYPNPAFLSATPDQVKNGLEALNRWQATQAQTNVLPAYQATITPKGGTVKAGIK